MSEIQKVYWSGRPVKEQKVFEGKGFQFGGWNKANRWLFENGFNAGTLEGYNPVGLVKGKYIFSFKWSKLTRTQKDQLDGVMISEDFRNFPVRVILFDKTIL